VFLHGKRGEVVVDCMATNASKPVLKNGTGSWNLFSVRPVRAASSFESSREGND
jgi:hypothetical protein